MSKEKLILAYKNFFSSQDGKVILKHLLQISNFTTTTHNPTDASSIMFREGRRSIILDMLKLVEMDGVEVLGLIRKIKKEGN